MPKLSTTRRGFMQLSATSAAFLAAGASFASLTGCTKAPVASGYKVLRNTDFEFITAIAPVVLGGSYPGVLGPEKAPEVLLKAVDNLRSEEHTSELQSRPHLVCRLLLEKKKK